jgi:hypothetical protein
MGKKDPRVDAYIAKSPDFAKPLLNYIRDLVHEACPDILETIKWSTPTFDYQGIMCGMAAFKEYCTLGFWKAPLLKLDGKTLTKSGQMESGVGQFGRLTTVKDLPSRSNADQTRQRSRQAQRARYCITQGAARGGETRRHPS